MDQQSHTPGLLSHDEQQSPLPQKHTESKNPPHVETLLKILRSRSYQKVPDSVKKTLEFNPVLGKYLDAHKDEEVAREDAQRSIEQIQKNKTRTLMKEFTYYNVVNFQDKQKAWALRTLNSDQTSPKGEIFDEVEWQKLSHFHKKLKGKRRVEDEAVKTAYNILKMISFKFTVQNIRKSMAFEIQNLDYHMQAQERGILTLKRKAPHLQEESRKKSAPHQR